ncbi:MAG: hypothetical protein AB8B91_23360 [Rubripirellula sp.]
MTRKRRFIGAAMILVGLGLLHSVALQTAYGWMVVDQPSKGCRVAIVAVPTPECYDAAAEMLNNDELDEIVLVDQRQPRSVMIGANSGLDVNGTRELTSRGVPADKFRVVQTDAQTLHQMYREYDREFKTSEAEECLVISTSTLSRYYRHVIDQSLPLRSSAYRLRSIEPKANDNSTWWHTRSGVRRVMNHGLRLLFVLCHGESEIDSNDPYKQLVKNATS